MNKGKIAAIFLSVLMISLSGCVDSTVKQESQELQNTGQTADTNKEDIEDINETNESDIPINVTEETIDVEALDREFNIFFIADSHISMCDDRDSELMDKASQRSESFKADGIEAWDRFDALIAEVNKGDDDIVLFGGDIIDSAMYASIEHIQKQFETLKQPYLYLMGNHDFEYGTEYFSPTAYEEYLPRLEAMRGDAPYQVKEYDDLIIFTADDDNSQIDGPILEAYKTEAAKGKPIVLVVHVPIEPITGDNTLTEECKQMWGPSQDDKSRVTMGVNGCYPNATTGEFLDLVLAEDSPVVLVLAGHIHFYHKDMLNDKIVQIVTGAAFEGDALRIKLK